MTAKRRKEYPPPDCPYCGKPAEKVTGAVVYPGRDDLADRIIFQCLPCDARVGCHGRTSRPLGRLANGALRRAKQQAHAAFDPLWKAKAEREGIKPHKARALGYAWLAGQLGIEPKACHIGMFDEATCARVVEVIRATRKGRAGDGSDERTDV